MTNMLDGIMELFLTRNDTIFVKSLRFWSIVLVIGVLVLTTRLFKPTEYAGIVLLIFFIGVILSEFIKYNNTPSNEFLKRTNARLFELQTFFDNYITELIAKNEFSLFKGNQVVSKNGTFDLSAMYIDSGLINYIYDISDFLGKYSLNTFAKFTKGVNNILILKRDLYSVYNTDGKIMPNVSSMFQKALILKKNTLNNLESYVYVIPKDPEIQKYLQRIITRYDRLITRVILSIKELYDKKVSSPDISTVYVDYGEIPKAHDSNIFKKESLINNVFF